MTVKTKPSFIRVLRNAALAVLAVIAVFAVLFVSAAPLVERSTRPTAADIAAARKVWKNLAATESDGDPVQVWLDNTALEGLAALASDATGAGKFDARVTEGELTARASFALPAGLWLNASVAVSGDHSGFPDYTPRVGRVTFPQFAGRWGAEFGRWMLHQGGVETPPVDEVFRRVNVGEDAVMVQLGLARDSGLFRSLAALGGNAVDSSLVSRIYCSLAARQRKEPAEDLSALVRAAFAQGGDTRTVEGSRAAFVALALLVVGEPAERLAPEAVELARDCAHPATPILLRQRTDLAKHWTFSAALTAIVGENTAASLGEWKELNDSLANGSGFSFVDLAADRAGMHAAVRALDAATAPAAMRELRTVQEDGLLPDALLEVPEGLSEAAFIDRYGSLDRVRYRNAVAAIDRALAQQREGRSEI